MGAHVAVQRCLLTVLGVADLALVGLEAEVEALVLGAGPLLGKALVAVAALEGLFAGVGAPMGLQVLLHFEAARAVLADVGSVVLVHGLDVLGVEVGRGKVGGAVLALGASWGGKRRQFGGQSINNPSIIQRHTTVPT